MHFPSVDEVCNSGMEILQKIASLAKGRIQIHLRGGLSYSESLLKAIKIWLKCLPDMEIASDETLVSYEKGGKSLLIDSRNGKVDTYVSQANPFNRLPCCNRIETAYFPKI